MAEWELLPWFVLRSAGFPWQLVEQLAYHRTREVLAGITALEREAGELAEKLRPSGRLARGQRSRLRNLRPMEPAESIPDDWRGAWNELTERLAVQRDRLTEVMADDARLVDEAIGRIRTDPRVADAIVCSSPAAYRELSRGAQGARLRRQVASYVQRLAAKSETMSFFGPINYGRLAESTSLTWQGHQAIVARQAYPAARVIDAVQAMLLADDELVTRMRPRPKTVALNQVADELGIDEFRAAVAQGRLTHDLCPPATVVDPLRWTLDRIGTHPVVESACTLLAEYPAAPPERKLGIQRELESLVPTDDTPQKSRFYNDRVIVHEAAAGTAELRVGGRLANDMSAAVAPVLDLLAAEAELTRQRTNRAVAHRLGRGRVPLVQALRRCGDLPIESSDWLTTAVTDLVTPDPDVDLAGRLTPPVQPDAAVLCSVDVLVAAPDLHDYQPGRTPLVLGDIHDAALCTPWAWQFHPDGDEVLAERDDAIRRALGDQQTVNVISRRTTGLPPLEFPGLVLELGGTASDGRERIGLDELFVVSDGQRAELHGRGQNLLFHNGELDTAIHTALALPRIRKPRLPDVPYLPRLRWGNVVLGRRQWTVPSEVLTADLVELARRGLPDRFFAKSPAERKPVYIDTASPDLLRVLVKLAATAEHVVLSEVLPAPEDAWLRDGDLRFAAELRCVYLRAGRGC